MNHNLTAIALAIVALGIIATFDIITPAPFLTPGPLGSAIGEH